jgi:hypothetical protein
MYSTNTSDGGFGRPRPDTYFGGYDNILEFSGYQTEDFTKVSFVRKLDTGDKYDWALTNGTYSYAQQQAFLS